ncbi:MAG TPA: ribosome maturation factor RimM, partial [Streptosporangiaceae bacterium]|nr:ribosome maturation factor RimM [Streptosporangiaceae bacterium]
PRLVFACGRYEGIDGRVVEAMRDRMPVDEVSIGDYVLAGGERLTVASMRWHSGQLLVAFAGITDRTAASELTGSWLSVDSSQLPDTGDPEEFRDYELIGLSVRTCAGDPVGVVTDVLHYGQDLLVVRRQDAPGGEALVPFVKAIVPEVDLQVGVVVIDPPPGLLDPAEAQ